MEGIAIMTSGGDAAGMNPAVKFCVEYARKKGLKPFLIRGGLEGLIDNNISEATNEDVSAILHRGGTILRSSRSSRFFEDEFRKQSYDNLQTDFITNTKYHSPVFQLLLTMIFQAQTTA